MRIKVRISTGKEKQKVLEKEGIFFVQVQNRPQDNKANSELLVLLKKYFSKRGKVEYIKIIKGNKSRDKVLEVGLKDGD